MCDNDLVADIDSEPIVCNKCLEGGLHWVQENWGWRLYTKDEKPHVCIAIPTQLDSLIIALKACGLAIDMHSIDKQVTLNIFPIDEKSKERPLTVRGKTASNTIRKAVKLMGVNLIRSKAK